MPRPKTDGQKLKEVLGACEYPIHGGECDRKAVVQIKGWALCSHHKRYGETMEFRGTGKPDDSAKIEEHNAGVEARNNGAAALSAFTPYGVYADLCALTDKVEQNMKRVPKGRQIAAYLNSARLLLLDEMSSVGGEVDPRQGALPLAQPTGEAEETADVDGGGKTDSAEVKE